MTLRKKPTGLSKKVPAIFEGLPHIGDAFGAAASGQSTPKPFFSPKSRGSESGTSAYAKVFFELGNGSIKILWLEKSAGRWQHRKSARFEFESTQAAKTPVLETEKLKGWLSELRLPAGFQSSVLFSTDGFFVTEIDKPEVPANELEKSILWEVAEKLPFPAEEAKILHEVRGKKVLVAALEIARCQAALSVFHECGIFPELVTLLPFAYETLAEAKRGVLPVRNIVLMNMGSRKTSFMIFLAGRYHSMRESAAGGEDITRSMMGTLVLENSKVVIQHAEAQTLKEELGLPTQDLMPDPEEPKLSQLAARVRPIFEKWVGDLKSSILQFQKQVPGASAIEEIWLSGGGAYLKGADAYLGARMGIPVRVMDTGPLEPGIDLSTAALSGLAYMENSKFNFADEEDLWRPKMAKAGRWLKRVSGGMAVGFGLMAAVGFMRSLAASGELKIEKQRFEAAAYSVQKFQEIRDIAAQTEAEKSLLSSETEPRPRLGAVLRELSVLVPGPMAFTRMSFTRSPKAAAEFSGQLDPGRSSPDLVLSSFLEKLNQSPFFVGSSLESRARPKEGQSSVEFLIKTQMVVPVEP